MVKTKLKFYFLWEVSPNFHIRASWPNIEKLHVSSVHLTLQCSLRPFWKCHIVSKFWLKEAYLKFHSLGVLKVDIHILAFWPKIASACNFTKSNVPSWVFFTFFKFHKWYKIAQSISYVFNRITRITTMDVRILWKVY